MLWGQIRPLRKTDVREVGLQRFPLSVILSLCCLQVTSFIHSTYTQLHLCAGPGPGPGVRVLIKVGEAHTLLELYFRGQREWMINERRGTRTRGFQTEKRAAKATGAVG